MTVLEISYIYHLNQELGMALPNIDIYNWLLVDILKVQPTGDPVNDSVYLVLLPMVVLYLYIDKVIGGSRFAGKKVEVIIAFIMGFFIIREGYYAAFASFSLPLLVIVMLWHTLSFILGHGNRDGSPTTHGIKQTQPGSGFYSDSASRGLLSRFFNPTLRKFGAKTRESAYATWGSNELKEEVGRMVSEWRRLEGVVASGRSAFGGGWTDTQQNALDRQGELEEELTSIANTGKLKNMDALLKIEPKLRDAIAARKR